MNNFETNVNRISGNRSTFLNNFQLNADSFKKNVIQAIEDNEINSIRVHKYLTETKLLGKVETARYLDSIGLDEKTKIQNLTQEDIMKIYNFINIK